MVRKARHGKDNPASFVDKVLVGGGEPDHFVKPGIRFVGSGQKPSIANPSCSAAFPCAIASCRSLSSFLQAGCRSPSGCRLLRPLDCRWGRPGVLLCSHVRTSISSISSSIPGSAVVFAAIHPRPSTLLTGRASGVVLLVPLAPEMIVASSGLRRSPRKVRVKVGGHWLATGEVGGNIPKA